MKRKRRRVGKGKKRKRMMSEMTEEEVGEFRRKEKEERNRKDIEFEKFFKRAFCKDS